MGDDWITELERRRARRTPIEMIFAMGWGTLRRRPDVVLGDRGYDHDKCRRPVCDLGVKPVVARRDAEHGSGLGTQRWVVERAFAHLLATAELVANGL